MTASSPQSIKHCRKIVRVISKSCDGIKVGTLVISDIGSMVAKEIPASFGNQRQESLITEGATVNRPTDLPKQGLLACVGSGRSILRACLRKTAVTACPAAASSRMNQNPVNELPPVKRIFMTVLESYSPETSHNRLAHRLVEALSWKKMPCRIEVPKVLVLFRDHDRLDWPLDRESWVVPSYAAFTFWSVELIDQDNRPRYRRPR